MHRPLTPIALRIPRLDPAPALIPTMILVTRPPTLLPLRLDEERFEGRDGGAPYPDVDFDHGPEVDGDAVVEGVGRFGVDADGVEADDGGDAAEYAEAEDAD